MVYTGTGIHTLHTFGEQHVVPQQFLPGCPFPHVCPPCPPGLGHPTILSGVFSSMCSTLMSMTLDATTCTKTAATSASFSILKLFFSLFRTVFIFEYRKYEFPKKITVQCILRHLNVKWKQCYPSTEQETVQLERSYYTFDITGHIWNSWRSSIVHRVHSGIVKTSS